MVVDSELRQDQSSGDTCMHNTQCSQYCNGCINKRIGTKCGWCVVKLEEKKYFPPVTKT